MKFLKSFLPILSFILIFLFSGVYFWAIGKENSFYIISPNIIIIPAVIFAWYSSNLVKEKKIKTIIKGISHPDILIMCAIFLCSGVFAQTTKTIGSVESVVSLIQIMIPSKFLVISMFLTAAIISTSIGSSMGTIATLGPIFYKISGSQEASVPLYMGTLVGGAMFGDNLSIVSDTTIASIKSQNANPLKKLKLNIKISSLAGFITLITLLLYSSPKRLIDINDFSLILLIPYIVLVVMAFLQFDIIFLLIISIITAFLIGIFKGKYNVITFVSDINKGFHGNYSLIFLTLMIGGLWELSFPDMKTLEQNCNRYFSKHTTLRKSKLLIAAIASLLNFLFANNVITIIVGGRIAKIIVERSNIKPEESAVLLDVFSCIVQGIIPYGAQLLLVSTIASISPFDIVPYVFYCYILGFVTLGYIFFSKQSE